MRKKPKKFIKCANSIKDGAHIAKSHVIIVVSRQARKVIEILIYPLTQLFDAVTYNLKRQEEVMNVNTSHADDN